jgi:integrase
MAKRLQLRSTRLHSLRHYSATELLAAGVDLRTVAGRLGHGSGGAITLKVYAAWVDEADRRAAATMAGILPRPVPPQQPHRSPTDRRKLRQDINAGLLQPGEELPTMAQIAAKHTVAVGTAHRAVALLANEGLVEIARGRRAVVKATTAGARPSDAGSATY